MAKGKADPDPLPGVRKEHFADLGWLFRELYCATLAASGYSDVQIKKVELALGAIGFDMATNRSVQISMRNVRLDLHGWLVRVPDVLMLDPIEVSRELSHRPTSIYGDWLWPDEQMRKLVASL